MKKIKKITCLTAAALMALGLTGCTSSMSYGDYDFGEYMKVGEYKGLSVAPYTVTVSNEDIYTEIENRLQEAAETSELEKGEAVEDGDTVNIDYVGRIDGKKFDNGSAEGQSLQIGSNSFIEGFEEGLIGKTVGSEAVLEVTFPEDYSEESLQGKDAEFTVTINSATREVVPDYDISFVRENTDYETMDEYEASVREEIYAQKEEEAVNTQKTTLWSEALDNTEMKKYPDRELDHYIKFNSEQIDDIADSYGVTREEVLSGYEFGDEDEFAAVNEDSSKLRVKQEMLIEYIAAKEDISYTEDESREMIESFEAQGYDESAIESQTGRTMEDYVRIELLYGKVLDFLLENANITEEAADAQ